jgi:UDP-4-amino-4-deoxy-L-arabinose formyltransferase/UDP-glucuronic acid dehydrogenase (UDP-4-keto-hexauronic acid decarboxylating)
MRLLIFGDESSLAILARQTIGHETLFVVAHNRTAAIRTAEDLELNFLIHVGKNSPTYPSFLRRISEFSADVILCFSYGLRIPQVVLSCTRRGAINFHGGLLPEWRGANIVNWVLVEGASETGVTAHWMTEDFDRGPIIEQRAIQILDDDTASSLLMKLASTTEALLIDILNRLASNTALPSVSQNEALARYFRRRTADDGWINWSRPDREIYNLIRALVRPWPGAFTILADGSRLFFRDAVALDDIASLRQRYGNQQ